MEEKLRLPNYSVEKIYKDILYFNEFFTNYIDDKNEANFSLFSATSKNLSNLEDNLLKLTKIEQEISILKSEQEESRGIQPYQDSTNLFKHIRHSITHNNYSIDYSKAFENLDLNQINFHFEDYDKKKNATVFKLDISASRLLKLIQSLHEKINDSVKETNNYKNIENLILREILTEQGFTEEELINSGYSGLKIKSSITTQKEEKGE